MNATDSIGSHLVTKAVPNPAVKSDIELDTSDAVEQIKSTAKSKAVMEVSDKKNEALGKLIDILV